MESTYTTRLAPSPTGAFHLGNARTFLVTWLRCRSQGGRLLMRMEDLDHPKVKPWARNQAYEDLRWLGLDWDAEFVQTERMELYLETFEALRQQGTIYPCVCSRKDIEAAQSAPHEGDETRYPNTCRGRFRSEEEARAASDRAPSWRFHVESGPSTFVDLFHGPQASDLTAWSGDFVVARGPHHPAYQLAVVVDDAAMGVTEVIRADDLLPSTHRQLALYQALNQKPPAFLHLPLVVGSDGRRLAKRHGDSRIQHMRDAGVPAETVLGWLAHSCGWAEWGESITAQDLLARFDMETIPKTPRRLSARGRELLRIG